MWLWRRRKRIRETTVLNGGASNKSFARPNMGSAMVKLMDSAGIDLTAMPKRLKNKNNEFTEKTNIEQAFMKLV